MLRLSKKAEYGIIALKHILNQPFGTVTTAKEISAHYAIPNEIMAKILQVLARKKLLTSCQGKRGGYVLSRDGQDISLSEIIEAVEGPLGIADCLIEGDCDCVQMEACNISEPLKVIQAQIKTFFSRISLADINNEIEMRRVVWH